MSGLPPGRTSRRLLWLLVTLVGMAIAARLGFWQLARAAEKQALQAAIETRQQQPAVDGRALTDPLTTEQAAAMVHRKISLRGTWVPERTIYLDNRQMHGRQGFDVLTPLRLEGAPAVVLVQRGWAGRNFVDRTALPTVETPTGVVTLNGRIAASPPRLYQMGAEVRGPIRQNLDLAAFRLETGLPLAPLMVLQTGPASEGLLRDWTVPTARLSVHYGYAFQWFGLSALIGALFVWLQFFRTRAVDRD